MINMFLTFTPFERCNAFVATYIVRWFPGVKLCRPRRILSVGRRVWLLFITRTEGYAEGNDDDDDDVFHRA